MHLVVVTIFVADLGSCSEKISGFRHSLKIAVATEIATIWICQIVYFKQIAIFFTFKWSFTLAEDGRLIMTVSYKFKLTLIYSKLFTLRKH